MFTSRTRIWSIPGKDITSGEGTLSTSASFRSFMANYLDELDSISSNVDNDVWLRPAEKTKGDEYHKYVLMYIDDI